ncbi:hypothetical protein [Jannaschia sp. R86511]|uniref:hypothetical protein n=1 Tax=Jannaschia sp. R86511 TaxID=3093853 RepID=UPI0036D25177
MTAVRDPGWVTDADLRALFGDRPFTGDCAHHEPVVLHARPYPCLLGVNGGSGLVSPDNDDGVARRMWRLAREAGLSRAAVVEWNVVPWTAGVPLGRAVARRVLDGWLDLLHRPERVVLLGALAREFRSQVEAALPRADVRLAPSPGQMARITTPDFEEQIVRALGAA